MLIHLKPTAGNSNTSTPSITNAIGGTTPTLADIGAGTLRITQAIISTSEHVHPLYIIHVYSLTQTNIIMPTRAIAITGRTYLSEHA